MPIELKVKVFIIEIKQIISLRVHSLFFKCFEKNNMFRSCNIVTLLTFFFSRSTNDNNFSQKKCLLCQITSPMLPSR